MSGKRRGRAEDRSGMGRVDARSGKGRGEGMGARTAVAGEATIERIYDRDPDWLAAIDRQAAALLADAAGESDDRVRLALALCSRQLRRGHVCLELRGLAGESGPVDEEGEDLGAGAWPEVEGWLEGLARSRLVTRLADGAELSAAPAEPRPLVLELPSGRLYLRRWWDHEASLAAAIRRRAGQPAEHAAQRLEDGLARLFPPIEGAADAGRRGQAEAAALALRRRLAVITGGPGTGKTTTVLRLLALVIEQALAAGGPAPRILLLAPTGKAAARMEESMRAGRDQLPGSEALRAAIPREASTIHRALGPRRDGTWRHDADHPLSADLVVVDEASMIDAALMRALLEALPEPARLVILGDPDQLASVDAGAVLADICGPEGDEDRARAGRDDRTSNSDGQATEDRAGPPIAGCIARLRYSFRFGPETGIGALARALRSGDVEAVLAVLEDPGREDLSWVERPAIGADGRLEAGLEARVLAGYGRYLDALDGAAVPADASDDGAGDDGARVEGERDDVGARIEAIQAALRALGGFRILCAHRRGPSGVARLGSAAIEALSRAGRIQVRGERWAGRPILILRNEPALGLYNGDVGLVAEDPRSRGELRAFFEGPEGGPRSLALPRLPAHETVLAMSIHKSQGSELDELAIVLPPPGSPLLTRELLYTAVTRARRGLSIHASREAIEICVRRRAARASGLQARLWGDRR